MNINDQCKVERETITLTSNQNEIHQSMNLKLFKALSTNIVETIN